MCVWGAGAGRCAALHQMPLWPPQLSGSFSLQCYKFKVWKDWKQASLHVLICSSKIISSHQRSLGYEDHLLEAFWLSPDHRLGFYIHLYQGPTSACGAWTHGRGGHVFRSPAHRAFQWTVHKKGFVLLSIFLDWKETFLLSLSLASVSYLKWQKLLKFQHGNLLNKQEQNFEDPSLSININPVIANP